jgi:hypothetical protein
MTTIGVLRRDDAVTQENVQFDGLQMIPLRTYRVASSRPTL